MSTQAPPPSLTQRPGQTRMPHGVKLRGLDRFDLDEARSPDRAAPEGRFGRMFRLAPFAPDDALLETLAQQMVEPRTPLRLGTMPAGYTVLGQFITHDLTFDTTPLGEQHADPPAVKNYRTPRLDLDSVYGTSPTTGEAPPRDPVDPARLRVENVGDPDKPNDLPRRPDGTARIGDPRNDENLLICQLHLAFLKLHNRFVDDLRAQGTPDGQVFAEAQRLCRWHFQWLVVHDYLPRIVGPLTVRDVLVEPRDREPPRVNLLFYRPERPERPMMPIEFAVAAFRFGHSMVGPAYTVNAGGGGAVVFSSNPNDPFSLNGSRPIPKRLEVAWRHFFDVPDAPHAATNLAHQIDGLLAEPLSHLPASAILDGESPPSVGALALRDLIRGKQHGLPSGQSVAEAMRAQLPDIPVLSNRDLGIGADAGWHDQAPLWFYVLREAKLCTSGERLGPAAGRLVAEVLLGLLWLDSTSYLRTEPTFRPDFGPPTGSRQTRTMGDLLRFAGVA